MKNNLIKIFTFVVLLCGVNSMYALCTSPVYEIDNYCIDSSCHATSKTNYLNGDDFPTILDNVSIDIKDNFKSYIKRKLNNLEDFYSGYDITIDGYCDNYDESDSDNCDDTAIGLDEIFDMSSGFSIYDGSFERFNDGKDFFFSKFSYLMSKLDTEIFGSPNGSYNLKEIHPNILEYKYDENDKHSLSFKNVCDDSSCDSSSVEWLLLDDDSVIKFLKGTKNENSTFVDNTGVDIIENDITYTKSSFKAASDTTFSFSFAQPLPVTGCATMPYSYEISYKYDGDDTEYDYMSDDFFVNYSGSIIGAQGALISSSINNNKLKIEIDEIVGLNKSGAAKFFLTVNDFLGNTEKTQMNLSSIDIISGDPVAANSYVELVNYNPTGNYYPGDTFTARVYLYDVFGNRFYDFVDGINIDYIGNLTAKLSKGTTYIDGIIEGVRSFIPNDPYFEFKFKFDSISYYDPDFNISYQKRNDFNNYTGEFNDMDLLWSKSKILIKSPSGLNDINMACTNGSISLNSFCISDNFSGCKHSESKSYTFNTEEDNGTSGFLGISDNAYNTKGFAFLMDHIDKTAPTINYRNLPVVSAKAIGDPLMVDLYDKTSNTCRAADYINYQVFVNGSLVMNGDVNSNEGTISIPNVLTIAGNKNISILLNDAYGNKSGPFTANFTIYPDDSNLDNSTIVLTGPLRNTVYANNDSVYNYTLTLKDKFDNPISGKTLVSLNQEGTNTLKTNMISFSGDDAIIEANHLGPTNSKGKINYSITSYAPGLFDETFKIKISKWDKGYVDTGVIKTLNLSTDTVTNNFLQPIEGEIHVSSDNNLTWLSLPEVGTIKDYRIYFNNVGSANYQNGDTLNLSTSAIVDKIDGHLIKDFKVTDDEFSQVSPYTHFDFRIDAVSNILDIPVIAANNLEIKYKLGGKDVYYVMDDFTYSGDQKETLGLRVVGISQGVGKLAPTGHSSNFTNVYKLGMKAKIKKNVYSMISGIKSGQTINGIKYINGDYVISDTPINFETIVVEDGNLTIDKNINSTLGIIVLRSSQEREKGNIYINANVTYIDGLIYADGSIISSNNEGIPFTHDSDIRTAALQNQLILKGSLFSANTIGGAILGGEGYYLLPLGEQTSEFDEAMIFDLNYIRRGNKGCVDSDSDSVCDKYENYFIIEYNPNNNLNPPKGFSISGF